MDNSHLVPTMTDRGFKHMPTIPGAYGGHVRVYESSSAEECRIWLSVEERIDANDPASEMKEAAVHLPIYAARMLTEQIEYLGDNHYHNDGEEADEKPTLPPHLVATETPNEVVLQPEQFKQILDALLETQKFLTHRDRMNAAIHCGEPRWSPLTEKNHDALHVLNAVAVDQFKADIR